MVRFDHHSFSRTASSLPARVLRLSKGVKRSFAQNEIKQINWGAVKALSLLVLSALMAAQAEKLTTEHGVSEWFKTHLPSTEFWKMLSQSQLSYPDPSGRRTLEVLEEIRVLNSENPPPRGSVWLSIESREIVYIEGNDQEIAIFLSPKEGVPVKKEKDWKNMGIGWEGVDLVLKAIKNLPLAAQVKASSGRMWKDSRQLNY